MSESTERLTAAVAEVRGEVARSDTKAAAIASLATFLMSAGTAVMLALPMPTASKVAGWAGVVLLVGSKVALVLAMRPRLGKARGSWLLHRANTPADLVKRFAQPSVLALDQAAQLQTLSRIGAAKFGLLRLATDLLLAALAAGIVAGALALL